MEEGNRTIQKNGLNRWDGRARFKVVKIAIDPRFQRGLFSFGPASNVPPV